jgi:hypothetical protein
LVRDAARFGGRKVLVGPANRRRAANNASQPRANKPSNFSHSRSLDTQRPLVCPFPTSRNCLVLGLGRAPVLC